MNKQKHGLVPVIIILVIVAAIGAAYFLGTQKNNLGSTVPLGSPVATQSSSQTINSDQDAVNNLVKNFYSALGSQDGKLLFSFLTPPSTSEEKTSYSWLTGTDLGADPFYRVFIRTKILNPKIDVTEKANDTTYIVKVTDQIQGLSNAGQYAGWGSPQPRYVGLIVIKSGDKWLVDKFTDLSAKTGTDKYSGFAQGQ